MSIIEYLQQTITRDLNHKTLQQIQEIHYSTETLLESLTDLRELDKLTVLDKKLHSLALYIETKKQIANSLNGLDQQAFQRWVETILQGTGLVGELARIYRADIQGIIVGALRSAFVGRGSFEDAEEVKIINDFEYKLRTIRDLQISKTKPTRQQIEQLSTLDFKFFTLQHRFQQRVQQFNHQIQAHINRLVSYEQTVRSQFYSLITCEGQGRDFQESEGEDSISRHMMVEREREREREGRQEISPFQELGFEKSGVREGEWRDRDRVEFAHTGFYGRSNKNNNWNQQHGWRDFRATRPLHLGTF